MIPGPLQAPASLGAAPKEAQVFPSRELPRPWGKEVCEAEMMLIPQRVWDSWSQLFSPAHSFPWLCSVQAGVVLDWSQGYGGPQGCCLGEFFFSWSTGIWVKPCSVTSPQELPCSR